MNRRRSGDEDRELGMKFRVNGMPAPQGSKRHVGSGRMVEMSKAVGPWREAVRAEAQKQPVVLAHALQVTVVLVLKRPKSHYRIRGGVPREIRPSAPRFPAGRPDLDKLVRAVLDGLVMGGVMTDDAQVVSLNAAKVYASDGQAPGALIEVEAMT